MCERQYDEKAVLSEQGRSLGRSFTERSQSHHSSKEASNDRGAKGDRKEDVKWKNSSIRHYRVRKLTVM